MPFDLERTTHRFTKTATGGEQTVVADDPADTEQLRLVREHLLAEDVKFRRGDSGNPGAIHGSAMPGLAVLTAGYQRVRTSRRTRRTRIAAPGIPGVSGTAQPQAVGDHEHRGQRHGGAGDHRVEQTERGQWQSGEVVGEGPEQVGF
jgi:hypothetical protein